MNCRKFETPASNLDLGKGETYLRYLGVNTQSFSVLGRRESPRLTLMNQMWMHSSSLSDPGLGSGIGMMEASGGQVANIGRVVDDDVVVVVGWPVKTQHNSVITVAEGPANVRVLKRSTQLDGKAIVVVVAFVTDTVVTLEVHLVSSSTDQVAVDGGCEVPMVNVVQRNDSVRVPGAVNVRTWVVRGQLVGIVTVVTVALVAVTTVLNGVPLVAVGPPPGGPQGSLVVRLPGGPSLISGQGGRWIVLVVVPVPPAPGTVITTGPKSTLGIGVNTHPG